MTKPAELYACLYARELPAQALLRLHPELRDKPCVVLEGDLPLQSVCSLNTRARLLGLRRGMTRLDVDTFPECVALSRIPRVEAATKAILLECAGSFSPRVEERSEGAAFLCVLDIAGTRHLFGPPEGLAQSILERVRTLSMAAQVTVSGNFHTAVCVAKGLSSRMAFHVTALGEEATALARLPLAVLGLDETQAETLELWGIFNPGMLAALPENELVARMGQPGRRLRQLARGELPHLFQPVELPFTLEESAELDSPVEPLESLLFGLNIMLDQLISRAKTRVFALAAVTLTLTLDGGGTHTRTIRPALPTTDRALWLKLLQLDLEAHPPQAAAVALALSAEPGSTSKVQLGLFSPQLPEDSRLDVTLARIRSLVGEENVGRAMLQDTHAMEAYRVEPFVVPRCASSPTFSTLPRACLRQFRPPEPASVILHKRRPAEFFFQHRHYAVEHAYGPWLAGGDWWCQTLWEFEQWDLIARAQDGSLLCCCMMRDLRQHRWQVAGLYD